MIRRGRLVVSNILVALIFFSSTETAGDASELAYEFYKSVLGLSGAHEHEHSLLHLLADKSVHLLLFFALGVWVCDTANVTRTQKLWTAVAVCLLVGTTSEILQAFTLRDPSVADVLLNLASGTLGVAVALRTHAVA